MASIDIKVPDIGDFQEVAVIEILVKVGDTVKVEQSLITVESDKASMEIPCSHAGVVKALKVKLSDKVKEGSVLLTLETADSAQAPAATATATATSPKASSPTPEPTLPAAPSAAPLAPAAAIKSATPGPSQTDCDVLVLGGGPGGYSAAFRAADLGLKVILVERYASLGGVCLNVGCIPSKALLHVASVMDEVSHLSAMGVSFAPPTVNLDQLRGHKDKVITKLTGGLGAMAKIRKVEVVRGFGFFAGPHTLSVEIDGGGARHETVLATLEKGKCLQYPLDFVLDATFTFKNTGKSPLHVSGYQTISSAEDFEDSDEEGEHSDEEEEAPKGVPFSSKVRATPRGTSQAGLPHAACCLPATHTAHRTSTRTLPARPPCPPQAAAAAAPASAKKKQGSDVTAKAVVAAVKKGKLPLPQLVWSPALPP